MINISTCGLSTKHHGYTSQHANTDLGRQGDVGWGVAHQDGRFSIFKRVWDKENGKWKLIAVLRPVAA